MDSPSSVSSYSSSSLSPSFSMSPVNSDFSFPSDNEREGKGTHELRPDTVGQRGGSRPSPGPICCRHRPRVSSNQHTAPHLEQQGSEVKRSRDGELETSLNTQGCTTEGDLLFAQKCKELQGFIRPLTDLLNGLKMGRFDRGLSSFQQSVAMDRIQRIVGVLQKPQMGERYLGTLLQVEGMLKIWFPHIAAQKSSSGSSRHQISKHFSSHHGDPGAASPAPLLEKMGQAQLGHLVSKPKHPWHLTGWPAMNLTWIHSTPICNPPLSSQGSIWPQPHRHWSQHWCHPCPPERGQPFTHSAPGTQVPPTPLSPVVPGDLKKLPGKELPQFASNTAIRLELHPLSACPAYHKEMTKGHPEPQMISHPPVAPDPQP